MKEIEVKAKIENIENLKSKLIDLGFAFSSPMIQEDIIFLPEGIEYSDIKKGTSVVRVRNSNGVITLTLKKRLTIEHELIKIEKEITVSDKQTTLEIVENMGFHKVVEVNKKRLESNYNDIKICIDDVEGLGYFVELEKMSSGEDMLSVQNYLTDFLQLIGIPQDSQILKGYDTLIYEKTINS